MAKDMSGFMKSFAGNLGQQLGGMSGMNLAGNPLSGIGMLKGLMGGGGPADESTPDNPGQDMFKGKEDFMGRFGGNLSDQLFQRAMMGFMGQR